jgi:uncharacterized membrane protein
MYDADFVTVQLIKLLKLRIPETKILNLLHQNEKYPSLLSVNESLLKLGIQTIPIKIDKYELINQNYPLIGHLNYPEDKFVIIKEYNQETKEVSYVLNSNKTYSESIDIFEQKWSGITICIDNKTNIYRSNLLKSVKDFFLFNFNKLIVFFAITFLIGGITAYLYKIENDYRILIIIPKFSGLIIALLITIKERFADTNWLKKICTAHHFFDCNKVIYSRFNKLFNLITLSDAAVVYFLFTISLFLLGINTMYYNDFWSILYLLNCAGLIIIGLSLYVQIFKTKAFCPLCLLIIASYLIETLIINIWHPQINVSVKSIISLELLVSCSFVLLYFYINRVLLNIWEAKSKESQEIQSWFTEKSQVIETILNNQNEYNVSIKNKSRLTFFYSNDNYVNLVLVINPNCIHCENIILRINELINKYQNQISIELIFNSNDEITMLLTDIFKSKANNEAWRAYIFFIKYGENEFRKKYKSKDTNFSSIKEIIHVQNNWCTTLNITSTPTIFLNNKIVPTILYNDKNFFDYLEYYLLQNL